MQVQIIKELRTGSLYDYIANNYWKMDKDTLKDIILELDYELYQDDYTSHKNNVADELADRWSLYE